MRAIFITATCLAAIALVGGCSAKLDSDPGPVTSRTVTVGDFQRIEIAGSFDTEVRTGTAPSVRIEGPRNAIERMIVEVKDGELEIRPENGRSFNWGNSPQVRINVTVPTLDGAALAGSGKLSIDRVSGDSFKGTIAGSARLAIAQLEVRSSEFNIAGSGAAVVGGRTEQASYTIAGSGEVDASKLATRDVKLTIAGSGNLTANASGSVTGDIMGSGSARVTGGATCKVAKMGSGSIVCA